MIKFELSNGEILDIPKFKAGKISFFEGIKGMKSEDHYDFSNYSPESIKILQKYILNSRFDQKDVKYYYDELFDLADYFQDQNMIYDLRKTSTMAESRPILMVLREDQYRLPQVKEVIDYKEYFNLRKKLLEQQLQQLYERLDYKLDEILNAMLTSLALDYGISRILLLEYQQQVQILLELTPLIYKKDDLKEDLLKFYRQKNVFGFEQFMFKEDAYYLLKKIQKQLSITDNKYRSNINEDFYVFDNDFSVDVVTLGDLAQFGRYFEEVDRSIRLVLEKYK